MTRSRRPIAERFWPKVFVRGEDDCWPWAAARGGKRDGYGIIGAGGDEGRPRYAHRVSWEIHFGAIPAGMHVLHRCDFGLCVNPRHLFLGTNRDNVNDMVAKGRQTLGEKNPQARLNESSIREIRSMASEGMTHKSIAAKFGVCRPNITLIVNGVSWRHVE